MHVRIFVCLFVLAYWSGNQSRYFNWILSSQLFINIGSCQWKSCVPHLLFLLISLLPAFHKQGLIYRKIKIKVPNPVLETSVLREKDKTKISLVSKISTWILILTSNLSFNQNLLNQELHFKYVSRWAIIYMRFES